MSAGTVVTRWTERPKPWHDPDWLKAQRAAGLTYRDMAETAGCTLATIRTAMNQAGLGGQPLTRRRRPPSARVAGLPPWPAAGEPVCDPNTCPGWENCLDDVDAPCAMLANYGQP